jgi:hypothetical protein
MPEQAVSLSVAVEYLYLSDVIVAIQMAGIFCVVRNCGKSKQGSYFFRANLMVTNATRPIARRLSVAGSGTTTSVGFTTKSGR